MIPHATAADMRLARGRDPEAPAIAWPGTRHVADCLKDSLRGSAVFAVVYGGADLVARTHAHRVSSYLPLDDRIPLVPWTTLLYSSLWIMFALVPFVLRRREQVRLLTSVIIVEILIAGVFFLLAPMPDKPPAGDLGTFGAAFRLADRVNLEYNQFPSLHAAFGFTLGWILGRPFGPAGRLLMIAWSVAIGIAAVLTWQHAILDVVAGAALAAIVIAAMWRDASR